MPLRDSEKHASPLSDEADAPGGPYVGRMGLGFSALVALIATFAGLLRLSSEAPPLLLALGSAAIGILTLVLLMLLTAPAAADRG
jgi:hypothetical protein